MSKTVKRTRFFKETVKIQTLNGMPIITIVGHGHRYAHFGNVVLRSFTLEHPQCS